MGDLFSAIELSPQGQHVTFESVYKSVQRLVCEGLLQAVNRYLNPAMEVRLGSALLEEIPQSKPFDIILY